MNLPYSPNPNQIWHEIQSSYFRPELEVKLSCMHSMHICTTTHWGGASCGHKVHPHTNTCKSTYVVHMDTHIYTYKCTKTSSCTWRELHKPLHTYAKTTTSTQSHTYAWTHKSMLNINSHISPGQSHDRLEDGNDETGLMTPITTRTTTTVTMLERRKKSITR